MHVIYKRPFPEKKSSTPVTLVSSLSTFDNWSYLLEIPYLFKHLSLKGDLV